MLQIKCGIYFFDGYLLVHKLSISNWQLRLTAQIYLFSVILRTIKPKKKKEETVNLVC